MTPTIGVTNHAAGRWRSRVANVTCAASRDAVKDFLAGAQLVEGYPFPPHTHDDGWTPTTRYATRPDWPDVAIAVELGYDPRGPAALTVLVRPGSPTARAAAMRRRRFRAALEATASERHSATAMTAAR